MVRDDWEQRPSERVYEEYELEVHDRASLKHIQEQASTGYADLKSVRDHINYIESLNKRITEVLRNEEEMGYINDTLKHDFKRIQQLRQRLMQELERLDQ